MEKNKITTYIYNTIVILCIVCGAVYAASQFMHFGGGEVTDNARVCQNIVPQNCRVQGFIREVRFTEFQEVKKGDTLVIIEDAEFRLRLAQAEADLARAERGSLPKLALKQPVYRWRMQRGRMPVFRSCWSKMPLHNSSMTMCTQVI